MALVSHQTSTLEFVKDAVIWNHKMYYKQEEVFEVTPTKKL